VSASRVRERERRRALAAVDMADPAQRATWGGELVPVVATLRQLADEATARPADRTHSRHFLRRSLFKALRELEARLDVAMHAPDAQPSAPAGIGDSLAR
jgi:hypothetical protein